MLKINRQTDYAVRVVLALAKYGEGARLSSAEIQQEMLIPKAFMGRIVAQLAHNGLINTFPGRDGGLMLPRPAARIRSRMNLPGAAAQSSREQFALRSGLA